MAFKPVFKILSILWTKDISNYHSANYAKKETSELLLLIHIIADLNLEFNYF